MIDVDTRPRVSAPNLVARLAYIAVGIALVQNPRDVLANDTYGAPAANIETHLDRLISAYPMWIASRSGNYLILQNGSQLQISDGKSNKSFNELIEHPDIDDMFYVQYPDGKSPHQPPKDFDPGRVRYDPLFRGMYGDCSKGEVTSKLKTIDWLPAHRGGKISITGVNDVDKALEAISHELDQLPPEFQKFLMPTGGTYNCRPVAGSNVRSAHGYGIAIDLNVEQSDYWRWSKGADSLVWKNRMPVAIVRVFEKHKFIWGGNWYHFDTMHFEYRPELFPQ
jgi:hypothetical protein